jgi:hypothetical protein
MQTVFADSGATMTYLEYHELYAQLELPENDVQVPLTSRRCISYDRGDALLVSPECLLMESEDILSFDEAVRSVLPVITQVDGMYETEQATFTYQNATLTIGAEALRSARLWQQPPEWLLRLLSSKGVLIRVPKVVLWIRQMHRRSVFAAVRDTRTYGRCRKTNYDIALSKIDGTLVLPGEKLNMNKMIAHDPRYCGGGDYMFNEGVCGGSTQLFWNALVNPYIYVTKRYNHNERYAGFYGSNVLGDDASMYEMSKQFEIQNIADVPIYFATFNLADGNTALLSFVEQNEALHVLVEKQQTGPLTSTVKKSVIDLRTNSLVSQQQRDSRYFGINDEVDIPYRTVDTPEVL